jgi:hypothetical protein
MSDLTTALERLEAVHRRVGSPVPDYLRPGADATHVREVIAAETGFQPTEELVELFSWHDGIDNVAWLRDEPATGYARLFGDAHFSDLDYAAKMYRDTINIVQAPLGDVEAPQAWHRSWFPAFAGGSEPYSVELDAETSLRGAVFDAVWHPPIPDEAEPRFGSLVHLVESVIARFEAGGYRWDPKERWLDVDESVLARRRVIERGEIGVVRRRGNPGGS